MKYPKFDKYGSSYDFYLYSSRARSILCRLEVEGRDLLSEASAVKMDMRSHESLLGGYSGLNKAMLYAVTLFTAHVPFGEAGIEYAQSKIGDKPLWQRQYEVAINNMKMDNVFFDEEEKEELKLLFKCFFSDRCPASFVGYVAAFVKLRIAKAEKLLGDRYIFSIFEDMVNNTLPDGNLDLDTYVPKLTYELDENKKEYIDCVLDYQEADPIFVQNISREEYADLIHGTLDGIVIPESQFNPKLGGKIKLIWDPLVTHTEVAAIEHYPDMASVPSGAYAVYNGQKAEDSPIEGSVTVIKNGKIEVVRKIRGYLRYPLDEGAFAALSQCENFNFIIPDSELYRTFSSSYDTFLFETEDQSKHILATTTEISRPFKSRDELMKFLNPSIPSNISVDKINSLTEADWEKDVIYARMRILKD